MCVGVSDIENPWRIEVTPAEATAETVFLHVLSTDDDPKPATLVRKGKLVGARAPGWEVLLDNANAGTLTIAGKSFPLLAEAKKGLYE